MNGSSVNSDLYQGVPLDKSEGSVKDKPILAVF